jgi:O-antigen/teichoic acid export membrane protein
VNTSGKTILKNASFMMISQVITWGLSLIIAVLLPRYLGVEAIGQFNLASTLWVIAAVLISFGMDTMLTKEVVRSPQRLPELFGTVVALRLFFLVLSFLVLMSYAGLAYTKPVLILVMLLGLNNLFAQIVAIQQSCLQGLERMGPISLATIIAKLFGTAAVLVIIFLEQGMYAVALISAAGISLNMILLHLSLRRYTKLNLKFNWQFARSILAASFPYLTVQLFIILYQQVDIVIMSWLVDVHNIGWYSVADKLMGTTLFFSTVFGAAAYPTLTKLVVSDPPAFFRLARKSFQLIWLVSVPIGMGVVAIATPMCVILFGEEFAKSGPVLSIMGFVMMFTSLNILLGQILICIDQQKFLTKVMAAATLATIPLDLVFVPLFLRVFNNAAMGGAFSFVVTELGMLFVMAWQLPKEIRLTQDYPIYLKVFLAGAGMAVAVWFVQDLFLAIPILVGVVAYAVAVLLLRVLPRDEWTSLLDMLSLFITRIRMRFAPKPVP